MKYEKFEIVHKGEFPIVRITYKTWYGKNVVRDVHRTFMSWKWVDTDNYIIPDASIEAFYQSGKESYHINGKMNIQKPNQ